MKVHSTTSSEILFSEIKESRKLLLVYRRPVSNCFFFFNYFNFGKLTESRTAYFGLPVFNISSRAVYFPSTSFSLFSIKVETPVSGQALNKN